MTFLANYRPLVFIMVGVLLLSAQPPSKSLFPAQTEKDSLAYFAKHYLPAMNDKEELVQHMGYALCYDDPYEQAKWVAYRLTAQMCGNNEEERTDNFREDKDVTSGSALPEDYKKSGYDRGHLCPAGDMAWSETTMSESFYMSNMSPQKPAFNRGIWKTLETDVREWAKVEEELYIVAGGVLQPGLETIGTKNKVAIPKLYYKVILDVHGPEKKAIAFVMPNEGSKQSVFDFAVSVDSVEHLTQINFFPNLPDALENNLEAHFNVERWIK